jgi:multimeric flavodoxin WrbA
MLQPSDHWGWNIHRQEVVLAQIIKLMGEIMLLRSCRTYITCMVALCAISSSTVLLLFAGIAAACEGIGGGGGGGCPAPSVSTGGFDSLTSKSVTLTGSVNPQGCYTEYAFEYGRSSEGYPDEIYGSAGSGTSSVLVSTSSAIVQPGTTYHYRLSAWSEGGEVTGGSGSFTTPAACPKPTVATEAAQVLGSSSAKLKGMVNPQGCATTYKFEWGPSSSPTTYPNSTPSTSIGSGAFNNLVSYTLTGLQPNTGYHYRISGTSSSGTTPGADKPFSTPAVPTEYVALGDSYSSGTGTGVYINNSCWRSEYAYPFLVHKGFSGMFYFDACHGATTSTLLSSQLGHLSSKTKFVTYTIGGNDAGFSSVVSACALPGTADCTSAVSLARAKIAGMRNSLDAVGQEVQKRAPWAHVIILGYPRLFNGTDCDLATFFDSSEMEELNTLADQLNNQLSASAAYVGSPFSPYPGSKFTFVNIAPRFVGHAVCDGGSGSATEWINGASTPIPESYHPKKAGHYYGYYEAVRYLFFP